MSTLLEIAKDVIKKNHKKNKALAFNELWKKTAQQAKIKDVNDEDNISEFYMALLQDPNFIKVNGNEWTLKEFHTYSDVEKMSEPVYQTEEFEIPEGSYDEFMSKYEISELKHKGRNSDTTAMDLEELESEGIDEDDLIDDEDVEYDDLEE